MPRFRRQIEPRTVQHVISRLVNREFLLDLEDARTHLLDSARRALARTDWRLVGYALMSNHAHWVLLAGEAPLRRWVQPAHVRFARWLRSKHGGLGPVFADRPRNVTFAGSSSAALLAYVHNNPVRAGVVGAARESCWTSHRAYVGDLARPVWLDVELGYELAGFTGRSGRAREFDAFVRSRAGDARNDGWVGIDQERRRVRARTRHRLPAELSSSVVSMGRDGTASATPVVSRYCPKRLSFRAEPADVVRAVAQHTGVAEERLRGHDRGHGVSRARQLAVHCWVHLLGGSTASMAAYLGVPRSTASSMLGRDVAFFDSRAVCARLERLEDALRA